MKPWEETWTALHNTIRCGESEQAAVFSSDLPGANASALDSERAKLAAQAPAMAQLLVTLKSDIESGDLYVSEGATLNQAIAAVLRAAVVIP